MNRHNNTLTSFKVDSNIIFKENASNSPCIFIILLQYHPWDLFGSSDLIKTRESFVVILNGFRRGFMWKLMSGNIEEQKTN